MNVGLSATLALMTVTLSKGGQQLASTQGAGMFGLLSQVSAVALVACIAFTLSPSKNAKLKVDTAADRL